MFRLASLRKHSSFLHNCANASFSSVLVSPLLSTFKNSPYFTLKKYSSLNDPIPDSTKTISFFLSDLFLLKLGRLDYITKFYSAYQATAIKSEITKAFSSQPNHSFHLLTIEDRLRDGGLRVYFKLSNQNIQQPNEILPAFQKYIDFLSTSNPKLHSIFQNNAYLVQGTPFKEDLLNYIPSRLLKVSFDGAELAEDHIYRIFRKYGKIVSIRRPDDTKAASNSVYIYYTSPKYAARAFNCIYGTVVNNTRITLKYQQLMKKNIIVDYFSQHSKFMIPILIATIATLFYSLFEPIRGWFIENKITKTHEKFFEKLIDYFSSIFLKTSIFYKKSASNSSSEYETYINGIWNKNVAIEERLKQLLTEHPEGLILVSGLEDIGKSNLLSSVLNDKKYSIEIDCEKLSQSADFSSQLKLLAKMVGYRPYFSFSYQMVLLFDKLLTLTTGQPSGFYNSPSSRFSDILDTAAFAIDSFKFKQMEKINKKLDSSTNSSQHSTTDTNNLLMGKGDSNSVTFANPESESIESSLYDEIPVIVISNFMNHSMEFSNNLIKWAAKIVTSGSAHVIFTSNNKSIYRELQQAIPLKTLNIITLGEASLSDSLSYVFTNLKTTGYYDKKYQLEDFIVSHNNAVSCIGSSKKDLDYYIHELISGKTSQESLDSVVTRAIIEITKLSLESNNNQVTNPNSWTRAQFWYFVNSLAKEQVMSYTKTKMTSLFNDNEAAILDLQSHNLISIEYENGNISVGKPIYCLAFEKLVETKAFSYPLQYYYHKENIAIETSNLNKCESELGEIGFFDLISSASTISNETKGNSETITRAFAIESRISTDEDPKITKKHQLSQSKNVRNLKIH
ncbi:hypothetical protein BB561_002524 [Smittium simulii]|uniref:Mitochondrial escape protein 2 n=1 Tax=Smittium simulii TaxID=133385 RepID=A0A2T9YQ32_9FUNG|nr:hypothetical protein BB561_002524 [Smittium simulii]